MRVPKPNRCCDNSAADNQIFWVVITKQDFIVTLNGVLKGFFFADKPSGADNFRQLIAIVLPDISTASGNEVFRIIDRSNNCQIIAATVCIIN